MTKQLHEAGKCLNVANIVRTQPNINLFLLIISANCQLSPSELEQDWGAAVKHTQHSRLGITPVIWLLASNFTGAIHCYVILFIHTTQQYNSLLTSEPAAFI